MDFMRKKYNHKALEKSIATEHNHTFYAWFKEQVKSELLASPNFISDRVKSLSYGPNYNASFYFGFAINGHTFYTKDQDKKSTMKNSGVTLEAEAMHFSSAKDKNPMYCKMRYYGVIKEIC